MAEKDLLGLEFLSQKRSLKYLQVSKCSMTCRWQIIRVYSCIYPTNMYWKFAMCRVYRDGFEDLKLVVMVIPSVNVNNNNSLKIASSGLLRTIFFLYLCLVWTALPLFFRLMKYQSMAHARLHEWVAKFLGRHSLVLEIATSVREETTKGMSEKIFLPTEKSPGLRCMFLE